MSFHARNLHRLLRVGFFLALGLTVLFGIKTTVSALYWRNPTHADQTPERWMPLGFVARSWNVPRDVLLPAIGVDPARPGRLSIEQLAEERGIPVEALIAQITAMIETYRGQPGD